MMKKLSFIVPLSLALLGSFYSSVANAAVYKCVDKKGKVSFQEEPCEEKSKSQKIDIDEVLKKQNSVKNENKVEVIEVRNNQGSRNRSRQTGTAQTGSAQTECDVIKKSYQRIARQTASLQTMLDQKERALRQRCEKERRPKCRGSLESIERAFDRDEMPGFDATPAQEAAYERLRSRTVSYGDIKARLKASEKAEFELAQKARFKNCGNITR